MLTRSDILFDAASKSDVSRCLYPTSFVPLYMPIFKSAYSFTVSAIFDITTVSINITPSTINKNGAKGIIGIIAYINNIKLLTESTNGDTSNSFIFDSFSIATAIPRNPRATIANADAAARTTPIARYAAAATGGFPSAPASARTPIVNTPNTPIAPTTIKLNFIIPPKPSTCFAT